jgi:hypothetical protein
MTHDAWHGWHMTHDHDTWRMTDDVWHMTHEPCKELIHTLQRRNKRPPPNRSSKIIINKLKNWSYTPLFCFLCNNIILNRNSFWCCHALLMAVIWLSICLHFRRYTWPFPPGSVFSMHPTNWILRFTCVISDSIAETAASTTDPFSSCRRDHCRPRCWDSTRSALFAEFLLLAKINVWYRSARIHYYNDENRMFHTDAWCRRFVAGYSRRGFPSQSERLTITRCGALCEG